MPENQHWPKYSPGQYNISPYKDVVVLFSYVFRFVDVQEGFEHYLVSIPFASNAIWFVSNT
jgi:hypothetical protein